MNTVEYLSLFALMVTGLAISSLGTVVTIWVAHSAYGLDGMPWRILGIVTLIAIVFAYCYGGDE